MELLFTLSYPKMIRKLGTSGQHRWLAEFRTELVFGYLSRVVLKRVCNSVNLYSQLSTRLQYNAGFRIYVLTGRRSA